jgi:hypothetical protein
MFRIMGDGSFNGERAPPPPHRLLPHRATPARVYQADESTPRHHPATWVAGDCSWLGNPGVAFPAISQVVLGEENTLVHCRAAVNEQA